MPPGLQVPLASEKRLVIGLNTLVYFISFYLLAFYSENEISQHRIDGSDFLCFSTFCLCQIANRFKEIDKFSAKLFIIH